MSDEGVWRTVVWIDKDGVRREMEWRPLMMTRAELEHLKYADDCGEYSCSMPTHMVPGKRWLRNESAFKRHAAETERWSLAETHEHPDPAKRDKLVRITWTPIDLVDLPAVEWSRAFA